MTSPASQDFLTATRFDCRVPGCWCMRYVVQVVTKAARVAGRAATWRGGVDASRRGWSATASSLLPATSGSTVASPCSANAQLFRGRAANLMRLCVRGLVSGLKIVQCHAPVVFPACRSDAAYNFLELWAWSAGGDFFSFCEGTPNASLQAFKRSPYVRVISCHLKSSTASYEC